MQAAGLEDEQAPRGEAQTWSAKSLGRVTTAEASSPKSRCRPLKQSITPRIESQEAIAPARN